MSLQHTTSSLLTVSFVIVNKPTSQQVVRLVVEMHKSPYFWLEGVTRLLLNIMNVFDISRVLDMHKYHNTSLFKKVVEQMKGGG